MAFGLAHNHIAQVKEWIRDANGDIKLRDYVVFLIEDLKEKLDQTKIIESNVRSCECDTESFSPTISEFNDKMMALIQAIGLISRYARSPENRGLFSSLVQSLTFAPKENHRNYSSHYIAQHGALQAILTCATVSVNSGNLQTLSHLLRGWGGNHGLDAAGVLYDTGTTEKHIAWLYNEVGGWAHTHSRKSLEYLRRAGVGTFWDPLAGNLDRYFEVGEAVLALHVFSAKRSGALINTNSNKDWAWPGLYLKRESLKNWSELLSILTSEEVWALKLFPGYLDAVSLLDDFEEQFVQPWKNQP